MNSNQGRSRYDTGLYARSGSRYMTQAYLRRGSRYDGGHTAARKSSGITLQLPHPDILGRVSEGMAQISAKGKIAGCAVLALAGVYGAGSYYYAHHYYPGSQVMGMDVSGMTAQEVRDQIEDVVSAYKLTITERSGEESLIYGSQVNLKYHDDRSLEAALKTQESLLWPVHLVRGYSSQVLVSTEYDRALAAQVMQDLTFFSGEDMVAPENAYLTYQDHIMAIVPEVMGTTLDVQKTQEMILSSLDEGISSLDLEACYVNPTVYADDAALNQEMRARNEVLGAELTMNFGDTVETVGPEQIMEMMSTDEAGRYYVPDEAVWNYVARLADTYDTYNRERTFTTTYGTQVHLYGGDYGWEMDQAETAQKILSAIRDKQVGEIEPVYSHTAIAPPTRDIGDTYIEISIKDQEMWLYKNGELLVDTPVVTGNPNKNNATPAGGVWEIDGKYTDFTLVGENYRTPVKYWLPFNGGVGIHDLASRGNYFGGSIYLYNGSHGCINTPMDAVALIYESVEAGTPVVVYEA